MDQFIKVAGTEGKVGGYFCRLPPLNENTDLPHCEAAKALTILHIKSCHSLLEEVDECSDQNLSH